VEVRPEQAAAFEAALQGLPCVKIGEVEAARAGLQRDSIPAASLHISYAGEALVDLEVTALVAAWKREDLL
jgi:hypothetical protein